jgi:nucleoside phosphorylase
LLAIVAALEEEVRSYIDEGGFHTVDETAFLKIHQSARLRDIIVATGALGRTRAQRAASYMIEQYHPGVVISAGFSGAAQEGLKPGDIFVCDRLLGIDGPPVLWRADMAGERPATDIEALGALVTGGEHKLDGFQTGGCLSVPELVSTAPMKAWIGNEFQVAVVDMESYWVSEKCAEYGIPHLTVRSVFDPVDQDLPGFIGEAASESNLRRLGRAMKHLATKPLDAAKLFSLASQSKTASASLGSFLSSLGTG